MGDDRAYVDGRLCGRSPTAGQERRVRTEPRPNPDRHQDPPRCLDGRKGRLATRPQQQQQQQQQLDDGHAGWWTRLRAEAASSQPPAPECRVLDRLPEIFTLPDDRALTQALTAGGYQLGRSVGHGAYSKVYVAIKMDADRVRRLACKKIDKRHAAGCCGASAYVCKFLPRELDVLRAIRHPHVVRTHSIYVTPISVFVFMDYCELGDLLHHLQHAKTVPQWQARLFFK